MKRSPRAIFFEDDPEIRKMVELLLQSNGCEVLMYEDPSLCLLEPTHDCQCGANEVCADIMITDIDMPYISGIDFLTSQVNKGCKVRHIGILSGAWTEEYEKKAHELGCSIFRKPSFFSELSEWIEKCVAEQNTHANLSDWFIKG